MRTLVCEGLGFFYSSIGLILVLWLRRSFFVGENLFNSRILRNPFLVGVLLIGLSVERKIFPYILMSWNPSKRHPGPVKNSFHPRQLHLINFSFTPRLLVVLSMH